MQRLAPLAFAIISLVASAASAEVNLFDRGAIQGIVDLRLNLTGGQSGPEQGGYSKLRSGGAGNGAVGRAYVAAMDVVWHPQLTEDISVVVDAIAQPNATRGVDAAEAYVLYKPIPTSPLHVQARAGMLYIPISLEHKGFAGEPWTVINTITPSAINSWVGDELKATGVEGRVSYPVLGATLAGTVGVFGYNDTSGTVLTFQGWSLTDVVATNGSRLRLPPMNTYIRRRQAPVTEPVSDLDRRAGWYGRWDADLPNGVSINAEWYDNNGDRRGVRKRQWSWNTTFLNVGVTAPLGSDTQIFAQLMDGRTQMGFHRGASYWVDLYIQSAYLGVSHSIGKETFTARLDTFRTRNRPLPVTEDYSENGSAALLCWKHDMTNGRTLLIEALETKWRRPSMATFGIDPHQSQTSIQASYRIGF